MSSTAIHPDRDAPRLSHRPTPPTPPVIVLRGDRLPGPPTASEASLVEATFDGAAFHWRAEDGALRADALRARLRAAPARLGLCRIDEEWVRRHLDDGGLAELLLRLEEMDCHDLVCRLSPDDDRDGAERGAVLDRAAYIARSRSSWLSLEGRDPELVRRLARHGSCRSLALVEDWDDRAPDGSSRHRRARWLRMPASRLASLDGGAQGSAVAGRHLLITPD